MLPWRCNRWFASKLLHALLVCKNKIESDITFAWHIKRARVSFSIMINNLKKRQKEERGLQICYIKAHKLCLKKTPKACSCHMHSLALRMPSSPHKPLADSFCSLLVHNWCTTLLHRVLRRTCIVLQSKEEIRSREEHVKKLLEMTPPKGKDFLHMVEHILEREKNWLWWKRDGCPPFEKQPIENKTVQDGGKKRRPRWRLGNKELSQLWKWADQNPNALTDPQRVRTPAITDYWKPLAEDMDPSAGIDAEYHHKNNRVYCWKGLRFSARQDLDGFSRFTDHGIEGVVPLELLPLDVRSKYQAKPNDRSKRAKKDEPKGALHQVEDNQISTPASEIDGEGIRIDLEASAAPMDTDVTATTGSVSQSGTPTPDEHQKQGSDTDGGQEAGQLEADAEAEAGMIDGETDAEVDLEAVG
ncbi:hypothetical protein NC651_000412 [Populus alba x Populus x berolinensis]|nr:hypothetical protein NC651_000412 [Populus alba x Populus x berolinensis]